MIEWSSQQQQKCMSRGAAAAALSAAVALLPSGCTAIADVLQGGGEPSRGIVPALSPDVADAAANLGTAAVAVADALPFPLNIAAYAAGGAAMWVGGKKAIHVAGAVCAAATAKFSKNKTVGAPSSAPAGNVQNADGDAPAGQAGADALPSAEMAAAEETAAATETGADV